ncbi:unnamed protein product [Adineta steineri]|uniref:Uncharacterized protein n=1 Tax=Adineta steineri TaxID=433720 RepID=A0A814UZV8_9BILA|nr:unnamed protein product [Adineta steineri]CAF1292521.1 unnamed protein product [Adineta steineri]
MDGKNRCHPYNQRKKCHRQHEPILSFNNRLTTKNHTDFSNQYLPATPQPLMPMKTISSSTILTVKPYERESWIRSIKKTKINQSNEQKTQYLETILRLPNQQKSSMNLSSFDRIRFASNQTSHSTNTIENNSNHHTDTCAIEELLFNNDFQSTSSEYLNIPSSTNVECESNHVETSSFSGFLIDNCNEEQLPPYSPPFRSLPSQHSTTEKLIPQNQEDLNGQCTVLINELDTADVEQRKEAKRQKRLHKKLLREKKSKKISTVNNSDNHELSSDWILECNIDETDQTSQLIDLVKNTSANTMTNEDQMAKMNHVLKHIKKQQLHLRKLRKYVISMLNKEEKKQLHTNQDKLMTFINQPILSGCWLCSGKSYNETSTQCNLIDK